MGAECLGCFVASLVPSFDSPKWRPVRGAMFMAAGISTVAIVISVVGFRTTYSMPMNYTLYAVGGYVYLQGAILYVLRIPERCKPGAFDICGASHQIFHFAVVIGCSLHFLSSYNLFR